MGTPQRLTKGQQWRKGDRRCSPRGWGYRARVVRARQEFWTGAEVPVRRVCKQRTPVWPLGLVTGVGWLGEFGL